MDSEDASTGRTSRWYSKNDDDGQKRRSQRHGTTVPAEGKLAGDASTKAVPRRRRPGIQAKALEKI